MKKLLPAILLCTCFSLFSQNQRKLDSLNSLLAKEKTDTVRFRLLEKILFQQRKINLNKALDVTKDMRALAEQLGDRYKADAYYYEGWIYMKQGNTGPALEWSTKSAEIYSKLGIKLDLAQTFNQIASIYLARNEYGSALKFYQQSIDIKEELGDQVGVSNSLGNIGLIYQSMANYSKALEYFKKAAKIKKELNDMLGYATCLVNMPQACNRMNNYGESVSTLKTALRIGDSLQNPEIRANALGNLAEAYLYLNDFRNAEKFAKDALLANEELADSNAIVATLITLSSIYGESGKNKLAADCALKGEQIARHYNWRDKLYDLYGCLFDANYKLGNFKQSADYLNLLRITGDSIYNEENARSINELETKYQTEKKDTELALRAEKLKSQQTEIEKQNAEKMYLGCGLILASLAVGFVYKGYRQKKKANQIISSQKKEVEEQRKMLETKNSEITDSIFYARRIQRALLTSETFIRKHLPESFVLYKPKDIVSGDFYWATIKNDNFMLMTADCTGHGVPGAFMSLLGMNLLNEIVNEKNIISPEQVLNKLRSSIISSLNPEDSSETAQDGMDAVFCSINLNTLELKASCANNPVWLIRNGRLEEIFKADKIPVGKSPNENKSFTLQEYQLTKGDQIYFFTDGFADQFGGPKGKKFKYKQIQQQLTDHASLQMEKQKEKLNDAFEEWKGRLEQVDDVCMIGIRV